MAGTSLLALIDDIASTLDDVAVMTKVATKKTAGVLGDDLALNAEQVSGVHADRELAVVWAVAKGSLLNKAILVPTALATSFVAPFFILPLLMIGGLYLCFEGFEKVFEKLFHPHESKDAASTSEGEKIKGAIRTDFILSAEIIVITLGSVAAAPFANQVAVLVSIAIIMTVGVYGLVAIIVKLDDVGFHLIESENKLKVHLGKFLLSFAPKLMKFLGVAGTVAMFLVGGGILVHGIPFLHHFTESLNTLFQSGIQLVTGVIAGGSVFLTKKLKPW